VLLSRRRRERAAHAPPRARGGRPGPLVLKLALAGLILLAVVLAVAAAEVTLRIVAASEPTGIGTTDPVLHHAYRPNGKGRVRGIPYETNSLGLRDREFPERKAGDGFRILMLGDSFTEGYTLATDATMPKRVERMLAERCGAGYEVVNGGIGTYSPILEYLLLERVAPRLRPDLVVLGFDMTDVHDDWIRTRIARLDAQGMPVAVPTDTRREASLLIPPLGPSRWLRALEPVNRFAKQFVLYQELRKSDVGEWLLGSVRMYPQRLAELGLEGNVQYDVLGITREGDFPGLAEAWADSARYIVGMQRWARSHGMGFALVVYPHAHQVSATESQRGRVKFGIGPGLYPSERPFRFLEDLGAREGFPVVTLLSWFRERQADGPLFWPHDIHYNPRGAEVFAAGVFDGLLRRGLVPRCDTPR
jgi:hypothetical protein